MDIGSIGGEDDFFKIGIDQVASIETSTAAIDATAGNAVSISDQNFDSQVAISATTAFFASSGDLTFFDTNLNVTNLGLLAGGTLLLPDTLEVNGDLRLDGESVEIIDGILDLTADRLLFASDSAVPQQLATNVNQLDVNVGGELAVNNTGDLELIDLDCDHIAAQTTGFGNNLTINVVGDLTVVDDVITGALNEINSTGSVTLTSTSNTTILDVVQTDSGDISIEAGQDLILATSVLSPTIDIGIVSSSGDATLEAGGDAILGAPIVLGSGNLQVNSGRDIIVNSIQAQTVSLTAQDDVQDVLFGDSEFIEADSLSIVAFDSIENGIADGVRVDTAVDNLDIEVLGTGGDVFVRETDNITLDSIESSGRVVIGAGGNIQAELIDNRNGDLLNDVRLTAVGDIAINRLTTIQGNVFLVAGDDVLSFGDDARIFAGRLIVRASNSIDDGGDDGIILSTQVITLDAVLGESTNGVLFLLTK